MKKAKAKKLTPEQVAADNARRNEMRKQRRTREAALKAAHTEAEKQRAAKRVEATKNRVSERAVELKHKKALRLAAHLLRLEKARLDRALPAVKTL